MRAGIRYEELFQDFLQEKISAGGDVGTIVTLVNVYQKLDTLARHFEFAEWLGMKVFTCELCHREFEVDKDEVEESDYIICLKCCIRH